MSKAERSGANPVHGFNHDKEMPETNDGGTSNEENKKSKELMSA